MKKFEELKEGNCTVIAKKGDTTKEFQGYYSEKYPAVFFTIPSTYTILGYIQD